MPPWARSSFLAPLPTNLPADKPVPPQRKRKRRWLRRFFCGVLIFFVLLAGALFYASQQLPLIAKWALERAFPGARVEVRSLDFDALNTLTIDDLELKSRKDGSTLLSLDGGTITFSWDDLRRLQIGEVRLVQPQITISPKIMDAFAPPAGTPSKKAGAPWSVRRLVSDYGELTITGYGDPQIDGEAKFSFDFSNFSLTSAPQALHELVLWDISATINKEPSFVSLDMARIGFSFEGLFKNRSITSLQLNGGSLIVGDTLRKILAAPKKEGGSPPSTPWTVGTLDLKGVAVKLDDNRADVTDITFALNTSMQNVPMSEAAAQMGAEEQTIEITDLEVLSPYNPLAKVLTLRSIFVRFTLAGLLRRELKKITIFSPTIYVGPDLFWYMDEAKKNLPAAPEGGDSQPGWKVDDLQIEMGKLVLGSGGNAQYGVPLNFHTRAQNVSLDNLAALQFEGGLEIPAQKYAFESYQIELSTQGGDLKFSYPPEKAQSNLVGKIFLDTVRWRQYEADTAWISVTFDRQGINGEFGGKVYGGYASGGFSFFFDPTSPWIGWLGGKKIDLRQLTNVISAQNFQLTGPLEFRLQMDAQGKSIDRIRSEFKATKPGRMVIGKLDDILKRIPAAWSMLKQSSTRIALETLRDFDYTKGGGNFWFVKSQGILQLQLQGPSGSRNFEVVLHSDDTADGRWKKPTN